jgi:hypothetical protein
MKNAALTYDQIKMAVGVWQRLADVTVHQGGQWRTAYCYAGPKTRRHQLIIAILRIRVDAIKLEPSRILALKLQQNGADAGTLTRALGGAENLQAWIESARKCFRP